MIAFLVLIACAAALASALHILVTRRARDAGRPWADAMVWEREDDAIPSINRRAA